MNRKEYNQLCYKDFLKAAAFAGIIAAPVLLVTAFAEPASNNTVKRTDFSVWTNNTTNPAAPVFLEFTKK